MWSFTSDARLLWVKCMFFKYPGLLSKGSNGVTENHKSIFVMLLFMDGFQLSQGNRATTWRVYFLPLSPQEFLVLIWSTLEGWKADLTMEPPNLDVRALDWGSSVLSTRPLLHISLQSKAIILTQIWQYWFH